MSELKRREGEESKRGGNHSYLYLAFGIGFVLAAIMIVITAGTAAGITKPMPAAIFLGLAANDFQKHRHALPRPASEERELLSAIRDNGGSITPAEAAMETSLTVREADRMLSELAGGGHLAVEGREGTLFYALPRKHNSEIQNGN